MIFENLAEKLQSTLKNLKGKGKLTEKDVDLAMREVKLALLEADVHYKVVKDFIKKLRNALLAPKLWKVLRQDSRLLRL